VIAPVALAPARYTFVVCQPAHFSIIDLLRPTLVRLAAGAAGRNDSCFPRGGVIITATLRDATGWDALVIEFGQPALRMSVECRSDQVGWGGVYWSAGEI
jgi:hypothetical protein